MKTRIIALALCVFMLIPLFSSCSNEVVESYMQVYLSHQVYDLDPLNAYTSDAQLKIVSLIFSGLYKIDEKGKVTKDLVATEEIINDEDKNEYTLRLTLNSTCWSDGSSVSADDVVYTFKRVLKAQKSNDAAALLFKIKNAVDVKNGDASIDDLGVYAVDTSVVEIKFEEYIDEEDIAEFRLSLTSAALFPLRENMVEGKEDWAKKPATMVFSGPFIIRRVSYESGKKQIMLERNSYYYRDREKDSEDKYVTPYKIVVNFELSPEEQLALYESGQVLYVNEIPLSLREQYKSTANISDALSTHTYYFNQEALVASKKAGEEEGFKLFAVSEVRQLLSASIDRAAIASSVVFAKPATGLLSNAMFNDVSKKSLFRDGAGSIINTAEDSAKVNELLSALTAQGITPSDYSFSISVRSYDEVHLLIANAVAEKWNALGFNVTVKEIDVVVNQEIDPSTKEVATDIRDDVFDELLTEHHGNQNTNDEADDEINNFKNFEVIALDLVAKTPNAFSVLAPFAIDYNGNLTVSGKNTVNTPHVTGYNSEEYNELINKAFNAATFAERAQYLYEAEKLLVVDDAAVMPIVFNQNAVLSHKSLSGVEVSYYGYANFKGAKLKDWTSYRDLYFPETSEGEETAPQDPTDEPIA